MSANGESLSARSLFVAGALAVIRYAKIHGTKYRPWVAALLHGGLSFCSVNLENVRFGRLRHFGKLRNMGRYRRIADMSPTCYWLAPVANDP